MSSIRMQGRLAQGKSELARKTKVRQQTERTLADLKDLHTEALGHPDVVAGARQAERFSADLHKVGVTLARLTGEIEVLAAEVADLERLV